MPGFRAAAASALLLMSCATAACAASLHTQTSTDGVRVESSALVEARRTADWQLAHMDDFAYVRTFQRQTADPTDWIQATFYAGLAAFADATGDAAYADAVAAHGEAQNWGFGHRPRHADDDAIGQAWVWAAARMEGAERARRLAPMRARFDAVLAAPSDASLIFDEAPGDRPCQVRWCWSDALFMAPPVWFELTRLTGDDRYAAHAHREFQVAVDQLYDGDAHLFYRDSRFIGREGPAGRKVFWSRGNGWTYAGLTKIIDSLPADDARRDDYIDLFRQMSAAIAPLQGAEGYWPVSLLDAGGPPETSGTGFFTFGLAWGVNAGLLDAAEYGPLVARGWDAMTRAVQPDGKLGWVQQVGYAPDQVQPDDTQLYGVGAYLMAASEVSRRSNW